MAITEYAAPPRYHTMCFHKIINTCAGAIGDVCIIEYVRRRGATQKYLLISKAIGLVPCPTCTSSSIPTLETLLQAQIEIESELC